MMQSLLEKKKTIREGRFELPTKGSPRRLIHTLQSSALPLSYPRMIYQALKRIPADTELFCVIV